MKKEIFTQEEWKEMEQMQERAKAKRLQEERERKEKERNNKKIIKKMVIKQSIKKGFMSLAGNMLGVYGIMKACYTDNMIMLLGVVWFILFINMMLTIND